MGISKYDKLDLSYTEVGILTSVCNKYEPGFQTFYLQSLNPMNMKANSIQEFPVNTSNIINKRPIKANKISIGSNIRIEMPKEVARNYPTKFIPPGTRFLISFLGGDPTKPVVVGRDYDGYEQSDNNNSGVHSK